MSSIVPSAGVKIVLGSASLLRLGSLKKKIKKRVNIPAGIVIKTGPRYEESRVKLQATKTKGRPSLARGNLLLMCDSSNLRSADTYFSVRLFFLPLSNIHGNSYGLNFGRQNF